MALLIRHPCPDVAKGICYGQLDLGLLAGWQQAMQPALGWSFDAVITSPLRRCREPAEWLAAQAKVALAIDPDLMEMHFGQWEGRAWQDFDGPEARAWAADFLNTAPPGGESLAKMASRVRLALERIVQQCRQPMIVTHAGPIRVLMADRQCMALQHMFDLPVDYATVYSLDSLD